MKDQVESTILVRRSTRAFSAEPFTLEELSRLLHFAYHASATGSQDPLLAPGTIDSSLIETYLAWNGADGAEPGIYYYKTRSHELVRLNPGTRRRSPAIVLLPG